MPSGHGIGAVANALASRPHDARWREALAAAMHPEVERSLVGALLCRPDLLVDQVDLATADFFDPKLGVVFGAMREIESAGRAIDVVTLAAQLDAVGKLDAIGGVPFLGALAAEEILVPKHVDEYARLTRAHAVSRRVLVACSEAPGHLLGGHAIGEELLDEVLGELERIERPTLDRQLATAASAVGDEYAAIERWFDDPASRSLPSIPWRIRALDDATDGVPVGRVTVVGARTGIGKSTLLVNFLMRTEPEEPGIVFSNEDDRGELAVQMLAWEAKVDSRRIRNRNLCGNERDLLARAHASIQRRLHHVRVVTAPGMTIAEQRRMTAADRRRRGTRWAATDYLQNVPRLGNPERVTAEIKADMQLLQRTTLEMDLAWMVVSQLNRDSAKEISGKKARRPMLHDFSDSTAIESCSKLALLLHRDPGKPANVIDVGIAKNKRGVSGPGCWEELEVVYEHAYIGDLVKQQTLPPAPPHYSEVERADVVDEPADLFAGRTP